MSLRNLLDVEGHIDREGYPDRWQRLQGEIRLRRESVALIPFGAERTRTAEAAPTPHRPPGKLKVGIVLFTFVHVIGSFFIWPMVYVLADPVGEAAEGYGFLIMPVTVATFGLSLFTPFTFPWFEKRTTAVTQLLYLGTSFVVMTAYSGVATFGVLLSTAFVLRRIW